MSLPPLASADDVAARMFRDLSEDELTRVEAMLTDVSAVVRNYTRQPFTSQRDTQRLRPVGYRIRLPRRPVVDVHSVALFIDGAATEVAGWAWDGGHEIALADPHHVINLAQSAYEWLADHTPLADVDYTSGYEETPDDVVAVVCSVIMRSFSAPGGGGIIAQAVGEYSYRLSEAAAHGPLTLTAGEKAILAPYRPKGYTVELRS